MQIKGRPRSCACTTCNTSPSKVIASRCTARLLPLVPWTSTRRCANPPVVVVHTVLLSWLVVTKQSCAWGKRVLSSRSCLSRLPNHQRWQHRSPTPWQHQDANKNSAHNSSFDQCWRVPWSDGVCYVGVCVWYASYIRVYISGVPLISGCTFPGVPVLPGWTFPGGPVWATGPGWTFPGGPVWATGRLYGRRGRLYGRRGGCMGDGEAVWATGDLKPHPENLTRILHPDEHPHPETSPGLTFFVLKAHPYQHLQS